MRNILKDAQVKSAVSQIKPYRLIDGDGLCLFVNKITKDSEQGSKTWQYNPIRAAMARTPEQSDYTSIQERIKDTEHSCLRPLGNEDENSIPFKLKDYLELVDWGGREVKRNKQGYIPANAPPILTRLNMDASPVLSYLAKDDLL